MASHMCDYPNMAKTKVAPDPNVGQNLALLISVHPELNSQPVLAKKSQVGQTTIGRIVRGEVDPQASNLRKICAAFDIDVGTLFWPPDRFKEALGDSGRYLKHHEAEAHSNVIEFGQEQIDEIGDALKVLDKAIRTSDRRSEIKLLFELYLLNPEFHANSLEQIKAILLGEFGNQPADQPKVVNQ